MTTCSFLLSYRTAGTKKKQTNAKKGDLLEELKYYYCIANDVLLVVIVDLDFYSVILRLRFVASQARISDNSCTRCPSYRVLA